MKGNQRDSVWAKSELEKWKGEGGIVRWGRAEVTQRGDADQSFREAEGRTFSELLYPVVIIENDGGLRRIEIFFSCFEHLKENSERLARGNHCQQCLVLGNSGPVTYTAPSLEFEVS